MIDSQVQSGRDDDLYEGYPRQIPYDEDFPCYYDGDSGNYFYYGYPIYWDQDQENFYYYSYEEASFMYVDGRTLQAIQKNEIYTYTIESGEYILETEEDNAVDTTSPGTTPENSVNAVESTLTQDDLPNTTGGKSPTAVEAIEVEENIIEEQDFTHYPQSTAPKIPVPQGGLFGTDMAIMTTSQSFGGTGSADYTPQMASIMENMNIITFQKPTDRFPGSIETITKSPHTMVNQGCKLLHNLCSEDPSQLDQYRKKPTGTLFIGRCKKTMDGLIKGRLELKALASSEVSSLAGQLQHLNLAQLVAIRHKAQNGSWSRAPQEHLKSFANKCDSCIAQKLVETMFANGLTRVSEEEINNFPESTPKLRWIELGIMAINILGCLSELNVSREKIVGQDGKAPSWWWLTADEAGVPKKDEAQDLKGLFMRVQVLDNIPRLEAQIKRPTHEKNVVYRLISGRGEGHIRWDVVEVAL